MNNEILTYENIKFPSLSKPQVDKILFNKQFATRIDKKQIRNMKGFYIFFSVPDWLRKDKNLDTHRLYGRIEEITFKGIKINGVWFPISQISNIFIVDKHKNKKTTLFRFFEEEERLEKR